MPLNESHIEEAALEWLAELGYAVGHRMHFYQSCTLATLLPKLLSGELSVKE